MDSFALPGQESQQNMYPACMSTPQELSTAEAFDSVYKLVSLVNKVQAKNCPVLIIQRLIRGYLTRQLYKYLQDLRIW